MGTARVGAKNKRQRQGERPWPPRSISDLWQPVAVHPLAIAAIFLLGKNFIGWHMNSKQEPIS
jgi:hypothetical protein